MRSPALYGRWELLVANGVVHGPAGWKLKDQDYIASMKLSIKPSNSCGVAGVNNIRSEDRNLLSSLQARQRDSVEQWRGMIPWWGCSFASAVEPEKYLLTK